MLEPLIEKALTFNEDALDLNNPSKLHFNGETKKFVLEWTDTGCYFLEKDLFTFVDFNKGRSYQLYKHWVPNEWNWYRALYLKGWNSKKFRIDPPLQRQEVDIHGITWEYTEFYRPGPLNGEWGYVGTTPADEIPFVEGLKNDYYELVKAAIEVANEYSLSGIPLLKIGSRQKDADGHYFIKDFNSWDQSLQKVLREAVKEFSIVAKLILIDDARTQQEIQEAIMLWETLYAN